jgi:hypothetical protein
MPPSKILQAELDDARFLEQRLAEAKAQLKVLETDYEATCTRVMGLLKAGATIQRGPLSCAIALEERKKSVSWKSEFIAVRSEAEAAEILARQPIVCTEVLVISAR